MTLLVLRPKCNRAGAQQSASALMSVPCSVHCMVDLLDSDRKPDR